jgi:hypothetical protein
MYQKILHHIARWDLILIHKNERTTVFKMTDQEFLDLINKVSAEYVGNGNHLLDAIAASHMARLYGWRVTRLLCSSHVFARHQRIMAIEFRNVFPERTELSRKSVGLSVADKMGQFWELVSSKVKFPADIEKTEFTKI